MVVIQNPDILHVVSERGRYCLRPRLSSAYPPIITYHPLLSTVSNFSSAFEREKQLFKNELRKDAISIQMTIKSFKIRFKL